MNKIFLIFTITFLLICGAYLIMRQIDKGDNQTTSKHLKVGESKNNPEHSETSEMHTCSRSTRLDNAPQYDRAISLINQRITEDLQRRENYEEDRPTNKGFKYFPPNLTNCIKINEVEIEESGVEGYFIFNDKQIAKDYYPISINTNYMVADDLLIALLLTHEITHVQQYIDELNGVSRISCINKEVQAFTAQLDFYILLNMEENNSLYQRIHNSNDDLHPQLDMLSTMLMINRESNCEFTSDDFGRSCRRKYLNSELTKALENNLNYKKQCNL